jgi:hypothetical protein
VECLIFFPFLWLFTQLFKVQKDKLGGVLLLGRKALQILMEHYCDPNVHKLYLNLRVSLDITTQDFSCNTTDTRHDFYDFCIAYLTKGVSNDLKTI